MSKKLDEGLIRSGLLGLRVSRREALGRGLAGAAGLMLADRALLATATAAPPLPTSGRVAKAKSVIQVFLWGGMSHTDTWDPKPDAGYDFTGQLAGTIKTNVAGVQVSELFPELAKVADKYSLIRSMTHKNNGHETAAYLMQTGHLPGERLAYPSIGAVFAYFKGYQAGYKGLIPPYVVLTQPQGRFSEPGFLGPKYKPFATGGDPNAPRFEVEGVIARGLTDERQKARRELLGQLNTMSDAIHGNPLLALSREAEQQAYELILGPGRDVFDLSKEDAKLRDRYGRHTFGQDCLAARRMVEAGVPYITINYPGGWDTHSNHFSTMRKQCPQLDQGSGGAAVRSLRPRSAGEHAGLVLRRVRPLAQGGLAAAVEWRTQSLRQRVLGAGGGRRVQGRAGGRRLDREGRGGQGPPRVSHRSARQHLRAGRHRRRRQAPASRGPRRPRAGHDGVRRQGGGAAEGDHVGGGQGSAFRCQP
jgi:hypothetical protein